MKLRTIKWVHYFFVTIFLFSAYGCEEDLSEREHYKAPEWLKGKIFSQILEENKNGNDLNTFIHCLRISKYDTILNTSGSFTVFAPTDEAFNSFFQDNSEYSSLEEMDSTAVYDLVKYQIIYNAWTEDQFRSIDVNGWVDADNKYQKSRGYKHKSLLRAKDNPYYLGQGKIVSSSESNTYKKVFTRANKYCPVFFPEYFYNNNLSLSDYEFYFDRSLEPNSLFFAGAKLNLEDALPAENGFVYKTDRVVYPLPTAEEILEREYTGYSYDIFLSLIHDFADFKIDLEATNRQSGAEEGLDIDTLYSLTYPELVFDIHSELTGNTNNPSNTIRYHHGLLAPTDNAFEAFINQLIPGGNVQSIRPSVKRVLINSHMVDKAIYETDINKGFRNGEGDFVALNSESIIQKQYGSNCTFLGLNEVIVPRIFSSILRPMYLTLDFEIMRHAIEQTGLMQALKKTNIEYSFYLPSDKNIGIGADSSLIALADPNSGNVSFFVYDRGSEGVSLRVLQREELRKQILNQIAVITPDGSANKEFLRNLGGNYIIVNNGTNTVRGTSPTTYGLNGSEILHLTPKLYPETLDNGEVYEVETFFSFGVNTWFSVLNQAKNTKFRELLIKCGLYDPSRYQLTFINNEELHTVFIPSEQALIDYGLDTLSITELEYVLRYHFVRGDIIFTDGKKEEGEYITTRIDENSTRYFIRYNTLHIRPLSDMIEILDKNGDTYLSIPEKENETNIMISYDSDKNSNSKWDFITTHVIHNIDKVLIKDDLQPN